MPRLVGAAIVVTGMVLAVMIGRPSVSSSSPPSASAAQAARRDRPSNDRSVTQAAAVATPADNPGALLNELPASAATTHGRRPEGCRWTASMRSASRMTGWCGKRSSGSFHSGTMPPLGAPSGPSRQRSQGLTSWLEPSWIVPRPPRSIPGRTAAFHRLNRTEYRTSQMCGFSTREIDVAAMLPADDIELRLRQHRRRA